MIFTDYNFNLDSIGTRKAHHDGEKGAGNPQDNFFFVVFLCYGLYASMFNDIFSPASVFAGDLSP